MTRQVHLAATLLLKALLTDSREAAGRSPNRRGQEAGSKVEGHVAGDTSHLATDPPGPQVEPTAPHRGGRGTLGFLFCRLLIVLSGYCVNVILVPS